MASEQEDSSSIESSSSDDDDIDILGRKINVDSSSEEDENDDSRLVKKEEQEDSDDNRPVTEDDVMDSLNPNTWTFKHFANSDRYHTAVLDLGTHTATQIRGLQAPDDYLVQVQNRENPPVPPIVPHPELPHENSSELLSALSVYAMELYNVLGYNQVTGFLRGDETALLALGVLVEEYVKEMLGPTGHLAYMEYEEPVGVSREARRQMAVPMTTGAGDNEEVHSLTEEDESDPDDVPGVDGLNSYDIRGFKNLTVVSHTGMSREKSKKYVYIEDKPGYKKDKTEKSGDQEENDKGGGDQDEKSDNEEDGSDDSDEAGGKDREATSNGQEGEASEPVVHVDDEDEDEAYQEEDNKEDHEEDEEEEYEDEEEDYVELELGVEEEGVDEEEDDEDDEDDIIESIPIDIEEEEGQYQYEDDDDEEEEEDLDEDDEVIQIGRYPSSHSH